MKLTKLMLVAASLSTLVLSDLTIVFAQEQHGGLLEEIIVTARKREESLQEIPEAVTAFTGVTIEAAGIDTVFDFANLTPNLMIREGFRDGASFITMRGVSTAQQGLPPVTFVVDGVQVASLDFINKGLIDIERIEVLRGPQGALYGSGAMAGAINVITKKPSNEFSGRVKLGYGDGDDKRFQGTWSGPLMQDKLYFSVSGEYRDFDGVVENIRGEEVDFDEIINLHGRILYENGDLTADLRTGYANYESGAIEQARIPVAVFNTIGEEQAINDFDGQGFRIASDFLGREDRIFRDVSLKVDYDLGFATVTSITAYSDLEQNLRGDSDWTDTDILGIAGLATLGVIPAASNITGRAQFLRDNFEMFSQEIRLTSSADQRLRWVAGAWYQDREVMTVLSLPIAVNTNQLGFDLFGALGFPFPRTDLKNDELWAVFGQVNYDITDKLELTVAARYDRDSYDDTGFNCNTCTDDAVLILTNDAQGNPLRTLKQEDSRFQPKVSVSYDWNEDLMTYFTFADGYRPGFFSTGNPTDAENTRNYEIGAKSTWLDGRLVLNGAVFFIEYSDQQFSSIIGAPPFRLTTNIPETEIVGAELEFLANPMDGLTLQGGFGYIDAEEETGATAPTVPEYTFNLSASYTRPLANTNLDWTARADYRHQGSYFIGRNDTLEVTSKDVLNLRFGLGSEVWRVTAYVDNVTEEFLPAEFGLIDPTVGFVKSWGAPRHYGVELTYNF